ncbi:MAG: hypothetical protein IJB83_06060 [Bacilli bacterium]|nr:hypothetical protein [Bacilli bacterium]
MNYDVLLKLQKDEKYLKFLRENSNWYKELNRNPESYDYFVKKMKEKYKLRKIDKVDNIVETIDLMSKIINISNE